MTRQLMTFSLVLGTAAAALAEHFDDHSLAVLRSVTDAKAVLKTETLTWRQAGGLPPVFAEHPNSGFLVVKTDQGNWCKMLVQRARQRIAGRTEPVDMLLIERLVTYPNASSQPLLVDRSTIYLFPGFRLDLDLGQIVPEGCGEDLLIVPPAAPTAAPDGAPAPTPAAPASAPPAETSTAAKPDGDEAMARTLERLLKLTPEEQELEVSKESPVMQERLRTKLAEAAKKPKDTAASPAMKPAMTMQADNKPKAGDINAGTLTALNGAQMYFLAAPLVTHSEKRRAVGQAQVDTTDFTGKYTLSIDGRWTATADLVVDAQGKVTGTYRSDTTGQEYSITGQAGQPSNHISFSVAFPRAVQEFEGYLWTRDPSRMTGVSRMEGKPFGFDAKRSE